MKVNGQKIKEIRETKGWSREFLAVKAGVSAQAVYSWENGNVGTFSTLDKVARALEVSEHELVDLG